MKVGIAIQRFFLYYGNDKGGFFLRLILSLIASVRVYRFKTENNKRQLTETEKCRIT